MRKILLLLVLLGFVSCNAQKDIPASFANIVKKNGKEGILYKGKFYPRVPEKKPYLTFDNIALPGMQAWEKGIVLDFKRPEIEGTVYYGLIDETSRYRLPVISKRSAKIVKGKAKINLDKLKGLYDFTGWEKSGKIKLGYRIIDKKGRIIADNRMNVLYKDGKYTPSVNIVEGPFLSMPAPDGIKIQVTYNKPVHSVVYVDGKPVAQSDSTYAVYDIKGLKPHTTYRYRIVYGPWEENYTFKTAPENGSRREITFAYASDSRNAKGGGERNIYGTNAYILKRMMIAADRANVDFFMFTGDLISGYKSVRNQERLEFFNFKNAVRYLTAYHPMYVGPGNHEALSVLFDKYDAKSSLPWIRYVSVDKYPFKTESVEKLFADVFVNPENGPVSEDGAVYDPSPETTDFPPYKETAYWFRYGNIGFIVLNSNYWYTTNENYIPMVGGNPHAYVMDMQLKWLKETLKKMDENPDIDHVFVTIHTPLFPNAGHSENDMWYSGNNDIRAYVAGKPVPKGIIERRDEILDALVNHSKKFRMVLAGDEHNYTHLVVDNNTNIYPEGWTGKRIHLKRPFIQITNGAAGAPYYALEKLPWTDHVKKFSTQNALMIFDIQGKDIRVRVFNPDTFETIESFELKE